MQDFQDYLVCKTLTPYSKDIQGHQDVLRGDAGRHTDTGVKDVLDMYICKCMDLKEATTL